MGKNSNLEVFYEEALSLDTPASRLEYIWDNTTSVRIRKAVASNSSASVSLLKKASRLYLEEVLTNDSFELLSIFTTSDEWINEIYFAYSNPQNFILKTPVYKFRKKEGALRAALCSEDLDSSALFEITKVCNRSVLKKVVKNKKARERIRSKALEVLAMEAENGIGADFKNISKSLIVPDYFKNLRKDYYFLVAFCNLFLEGFITAQDYANYLGRLFKFNIYIPKIVFGNITRRGLKLSFEKNKEDGSVVEYAKIISYMLVGCKNVTSHTLPRVNLTTYVEGGKSRKMNFKQSLINKTHALKLAIAITGNISNIESAAVNASVAKIINKRKNIVRYHWVNWYLCEWMNVINNLSATTEVKLVEECLKDLYRFFKAEQLLEEFDEMAKSKKSLGILLPPGLSQETKEYFSHMFLIN